MFQYTSEIDDATLCALAFSICLVPSGIVICASFGLQILKIRNLLKKNLEISCLVNIKFCRHKRPERMIHPHTGNMIPVRNKLPLRISDNCGIGSVHPDTAVIVDDHLPDCGRVHEKQCQTILPQIPPATSSFSVIMIRQERTAVNSPQNWLERNPLKIIVCIRITRFKCDVYFLCPVPFYFIISFLYLASLSERCCKRFDL